MSRTHVKDPRCPACRGAFTPDEVRAAKPSLVCAFCKATSVLGPDGIELAGPQDARCPSCHAAFTPDEVRSAKPTIVCTFCKAIAKLGRDGIEVAPPPPPVPSRFYRGSQDHRCPGCDAVFTPDEVRRAAPTIVCTFCKLTVLLRPPPPAVPAESPAPALPAPTPAPPLTVPAGFEITDTAAPAYDTALILNDPYRALFQRDEQPPRAGLTIKWATHTSKARTALGLWTVVLCAAVAVLGHWGIAGAASIVGLGMFARSWNIGRLHADHEVLALDVGPLSLKQLRIPADDVEQLYCVERSDSTTTRYVVYARDRAGRRYELAVLPTAEQAWWLEERLEAHLGLVDRPIDGEHRRKQLPP